MQFLYGDYELLLHTGDILAAPVDIIVNPTDSSLTHANELAGRITRAAGEQLTQDCRQLIREYGELETGMALYTRAGQLPYAAVIHAIYPLPGEEDEQARLELSISRTLQICEMNQWTSVAFPVMSGGEADSTVSVCAPAFFRAITRFWDARLESPLRKVILCLPQSCFRGFFDQFRQTGIHGEVPEQQNLQDDEMPTGYLDLSEEMPAEEDDDINKWFR